MGAKDQVTAIVAVRESADLLADLSRLEFDALRLPMQRLRLGVVEQRSHVVESKFVQALAFEDVDHTTTIRATSRDQLSDSLAELAASEDARPRAQAAASALAA